MMDLRLVIKNWISLLVSLEHFSIKISNLMILKKGISLHNLLKEGFDSICINNGTILNMEQKIENIDFCENQFTPLFEDNAYFPKRDWRKLNNAEVKTIRADNNHKGYNTVYVGDIPEKIAHLFMEMDLTNSKDRDEVKLKFKNNPKLVELVNTEIQVFLRSISGSKPFHLHCITANLPNLETVACDITRLPENFTVQQKKYIGLHNDGTQFMTLHTTYKHGNRIMINLSKESRIFYFVNLTMIQAFNMIKNKVKYVESDLSVYNIAQTFFEHFPDYPVIKISQKPYQYYIAPTDNCFHDGSTLGNKELDINIVYFGNFRC
jgi:hypothetical protein